MGVADAMEEGVEGEGSSGAYAGDSVDSMIALKIVNFAEATALIGADILSFRRLHL